VSFVPLGKNISQALQAVLPICLALTLSVASFSSSAASSTKETSGADLAAKICAHASVLLGQDKPFAALERINKLIEIVPAGAMPLSAWLISAKVYHRTNRLEQCLRCYDAYLKAAPRSDEREQYEALAGVIRDQVRQSAAKTNAYAVTVSGASDYFKEAVSDGFFRWPAKRFPLRVLINPADKLKTYKPEYEEAVRQAFDDWDKASGGKPATVFVESGEADITVDFVDDLHAPALKAEAGKAQLTSDMDGVDKASILLLTLSPFPDQRMTRDFMRMISVHEIGHALGLVGHSPYEDDVMFASLSAQRGISTRDVATLNKLYDFTGSAENALSGGGEGKESQTLLATAGSAATSGNFESLLGALPLNGKVQLLFAEAAKARANKDSAAVLALYSRILKFDPTNKNGLAFMANELNNIGLAKWEDSNLALKYFRWATYLEPAEEIYQKNISASLFNMQLDPDSQAVRVSQAGKCLAGGDYRGAVVEYRAALKIKADPAIAAKLAAIEKKASEQKFD